MTPKMPSEHAAQDSSETLPAPSRILRQGFGDYEVIGELGEGGMGRVYKAVDRNLGRLVAIKVLRSTDPFECSRFRGEAELIAKLDHPNIIKIFAIETAPEGRPYLVLELAEGGSLDRELAGQPQEPRRAAETLETVARAVHFAHEKGVIHRDLKPANVLRSKDKSLKLTDFGLAKELEVSAGMTPSGAVMGTPSYMSPEQAEGKTKEFTPATDVYGLGAILYEMLTGRPPFRGVNMPDTLEQVRWAEPAAPSRLGLKVHRDLVTICLKCLQKSPSRRYQTAAELAEDLRRWLNGETISARPAPSWERAWRQVKRRPWQAATVAASVALVLLTTTALYVNDERQRERRAEDARHADREEADRRLHAAQTMAALKLKEEQEEKARLIGLRSAKSLEALRAIREEIRSSELKGTAGLGGLHGVLADYYRQHIEESLAAPAPDRAALAELAYEVAELAFDSGLYKPALQLFEQARATYAHLAAAEPKYQPRLGDATVKIARTLYFLSRDEESMRACSDAERLWKQVLEATNDKLTRADAKLQLAEVWHIRGELYRRPYNVEKSRDAFTEAIKYRREVARDLIGEKAEDIKTLPEPDLRRAVRYLRELGRGYGYRGDEYFKLGDVPSADQDYWASHLIREKVVAVLDSPKNPEEKIESEVARFQFARSWDNLAGLQRRNRAHTTAKEYALKALPLRKGLLQDNPNILAYRIDLIGNLTEIAELMLLETRSDPASQRAVLDNLDGAITEAKKAGAERPGASLTLREALAVAQALRAEALALTDSRKEDAIAEARQVIAFLDEMLKQYPEQASYLFQRATMRSLVADLTGAAQDAPEWKKALDDLERALKMKNGYRERHSEDIRDRRYFRKLKETARFIELLNTLR